jgi:hypothetical protein
VSRLFLKPAVTSQPDFHVALRSLSGNSRREAVGSGLQRWVERSSPEINGTKMSTGLRAAKMLNSAHYEESSGPRVQMPLIKGHRDIHRGDLMRKMQVNSLAKLVRMAEALGIASQGS